MATTSNTPAHALASGRIAQASTAAALSSAISIERALSRFGWLGDPDDVLAKLGIDRTKLRALEHDDEITAALETRRDASLITPWRFEHPQARARQFFNDSLGLVMPQLMAAAWQAVPYGYSVTEVVYAEPTDPANTTPGRIGIKEVLECPMEWFRVVPGGQVLWRDQNQPVDPRKFFAAVRHPTLRKPMGDAILAKAYWPWYFRTHGWKYWAKFLEQAAVPLLVGKTIGDKEGLLSVLRSVTQGPAVAINDTDTLEALDLPGNSANKFTEFELACVRRIQRLILGQTLTSGTDGGSGNRALGEVHNEVRMDKKRADVALIAAHIQRIANMLANLNGMAPPNFTMEDGAGLERERADRDKVLTDAGMLRFTPEYLREKYALEESDFTVPDPASAPVTPPGNAPTAAALSARAVVNLVDGNHVNRPRFTAGQQAIEDEVDNTLANLVSPVTHKAIASAIAGATSPENLIERLGVAMADSTDSQFRQTLERALFAADLMGYGQSQASHKAAEPVQAAAHTINLSAPITIQMPEQAAPVVQLAAAPAVQVDVHVPVPQVHLSAPAACAPTVIVQAFPDRAVQTVETDEQGNVTRTLTTYEKE